MTTLVPLNRDRSVNRPVDVWAYVSPSRLNLWLKCPLAFKLRYIEGIITPTSPAMFVGSMLHVALECFYRHQLLAIPLAITEFLKQVDALWEPNVASDSVAFASQADEETCRQQVIGLVTAYLHEATVFEERPSAVEVTLEAPLIDPRTGENLGIPLLGVIDLVLDESAGPFIVDFKTAARSTSPTDVTHEIQLSSYAYLLRQTSRRQESGLEIRQLIKTKVPQVKYHRHPARSEAHFRRLFAVIRAYLDDLDQRRFVFRPGLGCHSCEFHNSHCASWSP
jgi:putative RecB family exonuclease